MKTYTGKIWVDIAANDHEEAFQKMALLADKIHGAIYRDEIEEDDEIQQLDLVDEFWDRDDPEDEEEAR